MPTRPATDAERAALGELARRWYLSRPIGCPTPADLLDIASRPPPPVPADLLDTITEREPYRSRALADGRDYLAWPQPPGLGVEVTAEGPLEVAPFGDWAESISPVPMLVSWGRAMDLREVETCREEIHRVACEGGRWRIVAMYSEARRRASEEQLALLRRHLGRTPS